MSRAW